MTPETATTFSAWAAVVSPWWLPILQSVNVVAGWALPVLGCAWLLMQMYYKRKRERGDDNS